MATEPARELAGHKTNAKAVSLARQGDMMYLELEPELERNPGQVSWQGEVVEKHREPHTGPGYTQRTELLDGDRRLRVISVHCIGSISLLPVVEVKRETGDAFTEVHTKSPPHVEIWDRPRPSTRDGDVSEPNSPADQQGVEQAGTGFGGVSAP